MADPRSEWTRQEQVQLDGITYTVNIEKANGQYIGKWFCPQCGERGESTLKSATPEQALERAKISLFAHHTLAHGDQGGGTPS